MGDMISRYSSQPAFRLYVPAHELNGAPGGMDALSILSERSIESDRYHPRQPRRHSPPPRMRTLRAAFLHLRAPHPPPRRSSSSALARVSSSTAKNCSRVSASRAPSARYPLMISTISSTRSKPRCRRWAREEVSSRVVGDMVIEGLKHLDQIAYIRYAIVYLQLTDLQSIRKEIDRLLAS